MHLDPRALPPAAAGFLTERHLATLTTLRRDGTPHVVAVGFTWDPGAALARVITDGSSQKAVNVRVGSNPDGGRAGTSRAVVCQVDGRRWLALEGPATVNDDPGRVAEAVERYTQRYRVPRPNRTRVAIEIAVDRILGWVPE